PKPFNVGTNYGGATISVNNKEMFIAVKNPVPENAENIDIFSTKYEFVTDEKTGEQSWKWTPLESIGDHINTALGWEAQPSLSGDGQRLLFAKVDATTIPDRNGNPSHDLFLCERQADGSWATPQPISSLNTDGQEKSPFIHSDSKTLYFSSNGHKGRGGMDIFYCKMNDDGTFTEPKNIGHPINTQEDETGLIVSADGEVAYFYSRRIEGARGFDIFSFQLPEKAKPERVVVLKGSVEDEAGEPVTDARVKLNYVQSKEIQELDVNEFDGSYATIVNVERGEDVLMSVVKEDLAFNSRVVANRDNEKPPSVVKLEVETHPISTNKAFVINDIYYSTNSADIDRSSKLILDEFALYLQENPSLYIEIRGHTDDVGSDSDNLALSMDRAFEVKGYLERQGVNGKRIQAKGFGESKPMSDNTSEEGRAKNRRTEFVIMKM
ncbi:MAG: OmpA family protein, partial [Flavobacteriales bacterium]|nr:OmpA family protein [Flavobacteriales bacterium]